MKAEAVRKQVFDLLKKRPFNPFMLTLDSGEQVLIEHPENFAYDPAPDSSADRSRFSVVTKRLITYGTFDAVSSVACLDERVASGT
jgi:hypothetical protein